MDRLDAFVQLLAQPDPSDLPARGHRWTCTGDPIRQRAVLEQIVRTFLAAHREQIQPVSAVVRVRRHQTRSWCALLSLERVS